MPVSRHRPHRSRRAELPHRAPTSGNNAQALSEERVLALGSTYPLIKPCHLPYSVSHILQDYLALRPDPVLSNPIPLGQPPSLHHLLRWQRTVIIVRGFPATMRLSDFPLPYIPGVSPWGSQGGPQLSIQRPVVGSPGSRVRCFRTCTRSTTA